jgi:hypothetical protein
VLEKLPILHGGSDFVSDAEEAPSDMSSSRMCCTKGTFTGFVKHFYILMNYTR